MKATYILGDYCLHILSSTIKEDVDECSGVVGKFLSGGCTAGSLKPSPYTRPCSVAFYNPILD